MRSGDALWGGAWRGETTRQHESAGEGTLNVSEVALNGPFTPVAVAEVTPTSVDFGAVPIGAAPSTKQVTLKNTGEATLNTSDVALNGPFTAPDGVGECEGNLAPQASCEMTVAFTATDDQVKNGSLVFTHNAAGSPITVPLTGSGFHGEGKSSLNTGELQFGNVTVGSQSAVKPAVLSNVGTGPLRIRDVSISDASGAPHFTMSPANGCDNATVQPGGSCTVNVRFVPRAAGARSSTLEFENDAPSGSRDIVLRGTGVNPPPKPPSPPSAAQKAAAGINDAKSAGANAPSDIPAGRFVDKGFRQTVGSTLPGTEIGNQTGGTIISEAGGAIIGQAGTNLISQDGSTLISQDSATFISQDGATFVARVRTNSRAVRSRGVHAANVKVKCPRSTLRKIKKRKVRKKAKCKRVVLATGITFLANPGPGVLVVRPTSTGKKLIKRAMRFAKAQKRKKRRKRKKVTPLTMSYATVVRPGGPGTRAYYTVKKIKIRP